MEIDFSILLQIIPFLVVIGIIYVGYLRHKNTSELRVQGIKLLQALRLLISNIQRHRGLSTAVLAGNRLFQKQLEEIEQQVSRDIKTISALDAWVSEHNEWSGITQHWARLAGNIKTMPIASSFEQHCRLLKNIMVFIDDLTLHHQLNIIYDENIDVWRELLILSEYIGQARALGTWVSIEQSKSSKNPFASDAANKKLESLNRKILDVLETPHCKNVLDSDSLQLILDYLIYIDKNVMMECPPIASAEFFDKSTNIISILIERMDEKIFQIHQFLNQKM